MAVKNRPVRPSRERANPFIKNKELLTDPVFLIGNGTSRENFDLERLRSKGTIIGCNALYRDFNPDLLIAIDAKMINEIKDSKYWEDNICIVPANRSVGIPNALSWRTERFNTSGCFGLKLISQLMKPKHCYMLGMDGYPGNVYDETKNYAPNTLQNFSGVLSYYMKTLLNPNNKTIFVNVNELDTWGDEATNCDNYMVINYEKFEKQVMM